MSPVRRAPPAARCFTLTELMVVVSMVGILAVLGIASFRKQLSASKVSEAKSVIQAIRAAQETYRAEHQVYLDVSSGADKWYPSEQFGEKAFAWQVTDHADRLAWQALNVRVTQPVQFRYLVNAGGPADELPDLAMADAPALADPTDPWYVIQARADYDEDDKFCDVLAWSRVPDLYVQNEGE